MSYVQAFVVPEVSIALPSKAWALVKRLCIAAPMAVVFTGLLVVGMVRLIATEPLNVEEPPVRTMPDIVFDREPLPPVKTPMPDKPEPVDLQPELPEFDPNVESQGDDHIFTVDVATPTGGDGIIHYSSDQPIATVLVQPDYPRRALRSGTEGYVEVRFDVTAMGTTENIAVLRAQPEGLFDRAAVRAVKNWKFSPVKVDGESVPYQGMTHKLVFEMSSDAG